MAFKFFKLPTEYIHLTICTFEGTAVLCCILVTLYHLLKVFQTLL